MNSREQHSLLRRQLRRFYGAEREIPEDFAELIRAVNETYVQFDDDRGMLERSLELTSRELLERNKSLRAELAEHKNTSRNLESSLALVRATLESTADGILVVDAEGRLISFNHKYLEIWDIPEDKIREGIEEAAMSYVQSKLRDPDEYVKKVNRLRADPAAESHDILELKDGRIIERYSTPQRVGERTVGRVWSFRDITERIQALEDMQRSEERFRLLFELAPTGMAITGLDGTIQRANKAFTKLTGYSEPEMRRMKFTDFTHSDDVPADLEMDRRLLAGESTHFSIERRYIRKDGRTVNVLLDLGVLLDSRGDPRNFIAQAADISERKRSERILSEEKRLLEIVARSEPLDALLEQLARSIERQLDDVVCSIFLLSEDKSTLRLGAAPGLPPGYAELLNGTPVGPFAGGFGAAAHYNSAVITKDIAADPIWADLKDETLKYGLRSCWSVPVLSSQGRIIGVFALFHREVHEPDGGDRYMVERAAHIAGIAIERKRSEDALRESEERYSLALQGANDGIWDWNLNTNTVYFSDRWRTMIGLKDNEPVETYEQWMALVHDQDREKIEGDIRAHLDGRISYLQSESRIRHASGDFRWVLVRGLAVRDDAGKPYRIAGSMTDITGRKAFEKLLEYEALHDSLTGLPNRTLLMDRLTQSLKNAQRNPERLFAVLFLDMDRFKIINDSLGHMMGDQLLKEIAERLVICLRNGDTIARMGGDEFTILLEDIKDIETITMLTERMLSSLTQPFQLKNHDVALSASVGIALSSAGYERAEDMLRDADAAMYRAKAAGKARYAIFDKKMHEQAMEFLRIEGLIRRSMDESKFELHYQPILSAASGKLVACEALLRVTGAESMNATTQQIVSVAEESGQILRIGEWALEKACNFCRQLSEGGYDDVHVSVNVSTHQFRQSDFSGILARILKSSGVKSEMMELEITESILLDSEGDTVELLRRLKDTGVRLAVDDFGTGYSSLAYLKRFPIDKLKIDRSFIQGIPGDEDAAAITAAIIVLGHSLHLEVTAEGVESAEQQDFLRKFECDYLQGYLLGRPMSSDKFREFLGTYSSAR